MTTPSHIKPLPPESREAGETVTSGDDHHNNKGAHHHPHVKKKLQKHSPKDHTSVKASGVRKHDNKRHDDNHESHDESKEKDNHHVIGGKDTDDDTGTNTGNASTMYMRAKTVVFKAIGLKPNSKYYPFFNDTFVGTYCSTVNGQQSSDIVTNQIGEVTGNFYLPASKFLAGHHTFKLVDSVIVDANSNTVPAPGFTDAEAEYTATGVLKQLQTNVTPETPKVPARNPSPPSPVPPTPYTTYVRNITTTMYGASVTRQQYLTLPTGQPVPTNGFTTTSGSGSLIAYGLWNVQPVASSSGIVGRPFALYNDPLAQSFAIDSNKYPNGTFATSIEVYFKKVDQSSPVTLELRNMENGTPGSLTLPGGKVTLPGSVIASSDNATKATKFRFDHPIFLQPNTEYCFVLKSPSKGYEAWVSKFGATDITGQTTATTTNLVTTPAVPPIYSTTNKTQTFTTVGSNTFTVPDGVTSLNITINGAGGGGGGCDSHPGYKGYSGHTMSGNLTVTPGDTLTIGIGGGGKGGASDKSSAAGGSGGASLTGYSGGSGGTAGSSGISGAGGGGGGATVLKLNSTTVAIAGGGGGGGGGGNGSNGQPQRYEAGNPTGLNTTTTGANGANKSGDGGAAGGGGGGALGGLGGTVISGDNGAYSGQDGSDLVPTGWTYSINGSAGGAGAVRNTPVAGTPGVNGTDGSVTIKYTQTTLVTAGTPETTNVVSSSNTSTGPLITEQPFGGVLFKSANDHTWTPDQLEDIKFNLYVARFDISSTGNLVFKPQKDISINAYYNTSRNLLLSSISTTVTSGSVNLTIPMHSLSTNDKIYITHMPSNIINGIDLTNLLGEFVVTVVDEDNVTITAKNSNTATITGHMISSDFVHEINTAPPVLPPVVVPPVVPVEPNSGNNSPATIPRIPAYDLLPPTPPAELGNFSFIVYSNVQANEVMIDYMGTEVAGTGIKELVKMADGQSTAGSETPYNANDYLEIAKDGTFHSFDEPRLLATPANEALHATALGNDVSTKVNLNLDSLNQYVSPVVDISGMSLMVKTHVIDDQGGEIEACTSEADLNDITKNSEIGAGTGNAAAKYKSAIVQNKDSAKELSIFINANCPAPAIIDCYIRTSNDPTTHGDRPWNWVNLDGIYGTQFKNSPDKATISEYYFDYTAAERFTTFDLKFVMRSTNNSIVPKIHSIRTMTVIDNG